MGGRRNRRLSYANVTATLALFVALGGGAYAAVNLPKNSVGPGQLRPNSVGGAKVRDGSLSVADLRPGTIPPPSAEPQPGKQIVPLKSGETMVGIVQVGAPNIEEQPRLYFGDASFPIPPPEPIPLANQHVVKEATPQCPGRGLAAPGEFCVWQTVDLGAKNPGILNHSGSGGLLEAPGFMLRVESTGIGLVVRYAAVWAYTAP